MTADRWHQLEALFHATLERPPAERTAFLDAACAGDEDLRREVDSLLAQSNTDEFLAEPALMLAARLMAGRALSGRRLGVYEVQGLLGAGGMGEVYRARDTKLGRDVAIKVLPEAFVVDAQRVERFKREARTLAALNHPNIGAIFGFEDFGEFEALVLELVEGTTLADRIAHGPLPFGQALLIARQIAEALDVAHAAGVIHRDLKPANIKVREDGTVKVLDFGAASGPGCARQTDSLPLPVATAVTEAGSVVGTAAYMSPEQASAQAVDQRSDIWAFGCVLYEMLTGRRAFGGQDVPSTITEVLTREPDWDLLAADLPTGAHHLVRRCLTKDLRQRVQHMGDVRRELTGLISASEIGSRKWNPTGKGAFWWVLGTTCVLALLGGTWSARRGSQPAAGGAVRRSEILTHDVQVIPPLGGRQVALSRNGTRLAYLDRSRVYVRDLVAGTDTPLPPGSAGTFDATSPFFSPDGAWLAYSKADHSLEAILLGGAGTPVELCDHGAVGGGAWASDGTIVFSDKRALWTTNATTGACRPLAAESRTGAADAKPQLRSPQFLPDGSNLLVELVDDQQHHAAVVSKATGEVLKIVLRDASNPRYLPTGHLVFLRGEHVLASRFDARTLEVVAEVSPILEEVTVETLAHIDFSDEGTVAYVPARRSQELPLVWVTRRGHEDRIDLRPDAYWSPRLSPRGDRFAVAVSRVGESPRIDLIDVSTGRQDTFSKGIWPLWMPDGDRIAFTGLDFNLWLQPTRGPSSRQALLLGDPPAIRKGYALSSSEKPVVVAIETSEISQTMDIAVRPVDPPGEPGLIITDASIDDIAPSLSPDARYVAYASDASGSSEIYVRTCGPCRRDLNLPDQVWQLSTRGGTAPLWSRDGLEIFYLEGDVMMAAPVRTTPAFDHGLPTRLFEVASYVPERFGVPNYDYDTRPANRRFIMVKRGASDDTRHRINIVFNWFQELTASVAAR